MLQSGLKKHYLQVADAVHPDPPTEEDYNKATLRDDQVQILTFEALRREWAAKHSRRRGRARQSDDGTEDNGQEDEVSYAFFFGKDS